MENRYYFRAKRIDTGEWIIGSLLVDKQQDIETGEQIEIIGIYPSEYKDFAKKIDPSTICQCTGLRDKNDKLIWEKDVVRVTINSGSTICRCAFADIVAQFQLWQEHTIKRTSTVLKLGKYECEVIGNIFDNPELLEV